MLKVYLTDLAAYNSGALIGKWITLPIDEEELSQEIEEVLRAGELTVDGDMHEEWFITDYEWEEVELWDIGEYENLQQLNNKLQSIEHLDTKQLQAVSFLLFQELANDLDDALVKCDDVIVYQNQSMEDLAYELINECYGVDELPSIISCHIDYKAIARDLEIDGNYTVIDADVYEYIG